MEVRELRSFVAAARLRSVSRAAETLDIGQPAVSTHIRKLERELRTRLFDRVKRPILLTRAGERLAAMAGPLIEDFDQLAESTAQAEAEAPVTIVSTPTLVSHFLIRALSGFRAQNPGVHVRLRSRLRPDVARMVSEGEADFGIVPGFPNDADLEFDSVFPYEWMLIAPAGHALMDEPIPSLEAIAANPLVLMEPRTNTRTGLESALQRRGLRYDVAVELDSMDNVKRYVELGHGISVVPRLVIEPEDRHLLDVTTVSHLLPTELAGMIWLRGRSLAPVVEASMEAVRAAAGAVGKD